MAAVPRDPNFWKRFSRAIHLDEEQNIHPTMASPATRPELKHSNSWLEREKQKTRRNKILFCLALLGFIGFGIAIIVVLAWLVRHDWFKNGGKVVFP